MSDPHGALRVRLVREHDLTPAEDDAIKRLLVAAFSQHAETFSTASYSGARPECRLWLETPDGAMVAHLDFERRVIGVGDTDILVAGIGEVATHPDWQGTGVGRRMVGALRAILRTSHPVPFGYLNCLEAVAGFYTSVGFHPSDRRVHEIDRETGQPGEFDGRCMVLPACAPIELFPAEGLIDLRGLPW